MKKSIMTILVFSIFLGFNLPLFAQFTPEEVEAREKWEEFLRTGGAGITPIATIKGLYDPDRPEVGRGWTRRPSAGPAANTVVPKVVGRRGVKAMRDIRTYRYGNRTGVYRRTWHE